jgi:peptidoglycan/xylan/chitin deacetylase (PgdA/CDA1 family)
MRGKIPLVSCLIAGVLGVGAGAWPEIRSQSMSGSDGPSLRSRLAADVADQQWERPKPGTWTLPVKSPDGLPTVINQIKTQDKVVFLTIDDGWEHDPGFVDIVRQQKVPILTFLTNDAAKGHYEYFWALKHAGSQLENHTLHHPNMAVLPLDRQKKEICETGDIIAAQYGRRPQIFRPPFGSFNQLTRQAAAACGIKSILIWSAEFYNGTNSPQGVHNAFARADGGTGFRAGDIMLMHYRPGLAKDFQTVLGWVRQQGFRPAAIQNYLPVSLGGNAPDQQPAGTPVKTG